MDNTAVDALVDLGFTALEAEAYAWLHRQPNATGYRVAQALGKPVANTYKALESLHNKGAILVEEDENRMCRAVAAEELLRQLERKFARTSRAARQALAPPATADGDDRVYSLRTPAQVLERARAMLQAARTIVLVDAFPAALEAVRPELEAAVGRGVTVAIKVYRAAELAGAQVYCDARGEQAIARWPGEWLNLVVDGATHALALLTPDLARVHQAIWTASPYLAWIYHSALANELVIAEIEALAQAGGRNDRLRRVLARRDALFPREAAGYRTLKRRFSRAASKSDPGAGRARRGSR